MNDELTLYERMNHLSTQMAKAAAACDWDQLTLLERDCAQIARTLEARAAPTPLSVAERRRKVELIHRILDDDAEVRRHAEPWMEHVRQFLGDGARKNRLRQAYGTGAAYVAP